MELSKEKRAASLLGKLKLYRNTDFGKRPFFIEITGTPSSGKTTTIDILDTFFRRQGFNVYTPQEGAKVIRHISRKTHLYNIRTGLYALTNLIDESVNDNHDLVLFDRCLYDAFVWMEYWERKKDLSEETKKLFQAFFTFPGWTNWLDAIFFVVADPEEAVSRERKINISEKMGDTTNPQTISMQLEIYKKVWVRHVELLKNMFMVETTDLDRKEMAEAVLSQALTALEKRF